MRHSAVERRKRIRDIAVLITFILLSYLLGYTCQVVMSQPFNESAWWGIPTIFLVACVWFPSFLKFIAIVDKIAKVWER